SLNFKWEANTLEVAQSIPDEEKTTRFIVWMRRFLSTQDPLHYQRVWGYVQSTMGAYLTTEETAGVETLIAQMRAGHVPFKLDGRDIAAEEAYHLIGDNWFNGLDAGKELAQLFEEAHPLGPLLWHLFFTYSEAALRVTSALFGVVRRIEKDETYKQ